MALGFECPLWIPLRGNELALLSPRDGEGRYPWSFGAGQGALVTGLGVIPYVLRSIKEFYPDVSASFDWRNPPQEPGRILFWEAFVAGSDKGKDHEDDAMLAVKAFSNALTDLDAVQKLKPETGMNLLGAMLLRCGWTDDLSVLASEMLVVRQ